MSGELLTAHCPAKINLTLHVLGRRSDGYHELDTVFQSIALWDRLTASEADDLTLTCDDPEVPSGPSNLVLRAAQLLAREAGRTAGASLRLEKSIPSRAGLGGGSSDAAGALLLCARLWRLEREPEVLAGLAAELGADVPYFLVGGTARGEGRGDRITPLPPLPETCLVLGLPPFGIATSEVFGRLAERLTLPENGVNLPRPRAHKWLEENDFYSIRAARNDLESVVFEGWPELMRFREALVEQGATSALLSGSGSALFGLFGGSAAAESAAAALSARFESWRVLTSHTVERGVRLESSG